MPRLEIHCHGVSVAPDEKLYYYGSNNSDWSYAVPFDRAAPVFALDNIPSDVEFKVLLVSGGPTFADGINLAASDFGQHRVAYDSVNSGGHGDRDPVHNRRICDQSLETRVHTVLLGPVDFPSLGGPSSSSPCCVFDKLWFGAQMGDQWPLMNVLGTMADGTNVTDTPFIGVRRELANDGTSEETYLAAVRGQGKKAIVICSYQCFPRRNANPHDPSMEFEDDVQRYINKYAPMDCILVCHCFRDPRHHIPAAYPLLLYSETDQYAHLAYLYNVDVTPVADKTWDFVVNMPGGDWQAWIRNLGIARRWLNYMADTMGLRILVCGDDRERDFSAKITVIKFQPWDTFMKQYLAKSRFLFCASKYDASPRILIESLALDVPILVNEDILGGWKYVVERETGSLFCPDEDVCKKITRFMSHAGKYKAREWLRLNLNVEHNQRLLAKTVAEICGRKWTDYVDGVLYLNLASRMDRRLRMHETLLKKWEMPPDIVHRIEVRENDNKKTHAHIKALDYAKVRGWRRFLVLDDVFEVAVNKEVALHILNELDHQKSWSVFLLAATIASECETYPNQSLLKRVKCNTKPAGMLIKAECIETLRAHAFDQQWMALQATDVFVISEPSLGDSLSH